MLVLLKELFFRMNKIIEKNCPHKTIRQKSSTFVHSYTEYAQQRESEPSGQGPYWAAAVGVQFARCGGHRGDVDLQRHRPNLYRSWRGT